MRRSFQKALAAICLLAVLAGLAAGWCSPERRVARYVTAHRAELQEAMDRYFEQGQHLSCGSGILSANDWPGQHPMVEYLLFTGATGYYGFYYSPDDVPLAFQNVPVPLTETADGWQWQGKGDNRGITRRLSPQWFFFEAHF